MFMDSLHEVITDSRIFQLGCLLRDGYVFAPLTQSNIYDAVVIRTSDDCRAMGVHGFSEHSLAEHIAFINRHKLEKAIVVAKDISFIRECPTLKYLKVCPADTAADKFDYSPLYDMPNLQYLVCMTAYGGLKDPLSTTIDYSRIYGLRDLDIAGKGHLNYNLIDTLEVLTISGDRSHQNLKSVSCSTNLKKLWFLQCGLKSLEGIDQFPNLQNLAFDYMRSLQDISQLSHAAASLRVLIIENCPKITDFECLYDLVNLEHLYLHGKNILPSLDFLNHMKKLQTFTFSMTVSDCDLTPCLRIPYASSFKNRKQYNLKDKDLPKQVPSKPFELI